MAVALKKVVDDRKKDIEGMMYDKARGVFVEKPREVVEFDLKNGSVQARMDTEISLIKGGAAARSGLSAASLSSPVRLTAKKKGVEEEEKGPELEIIAIDGKTSSNVVLKGVD